MKYKRFASLFCALLIAVNCFAAPSRAEAVKSDTEQFSVNAVLGTIPLNVEIAANSIVRSGTSFLLAIGEEVTINATYWPSNANVDFGLIAPDGLFYPINVTTGSIQETIQVSQRGYYYIAIRNNSGFAISVSGFVSA